MICIIYIPYCNYNISQHLFNLYHSNYDCQKESFLHKSFKYESGQKCILLPLFAYLFSINSSFICIQISLPLIFIYDPAKFVNIAQSHFFNKYRYLSNKFSTPCWKSCWNLRFYRPFSTLKMSKSVEKQNAHFYNNIMLCYKCRKR